jgi:hypothetical protein
MESPKIFSMSFSRIYELYIAKAEKKGRTTSEVNTIICWLFGYNQEELRRQVQQGVSVESFITSTPHPNPARNLITGSICGVRLDSITDPVMKEIRYLDKLIDELAKGKSMDKILRLQVTESVPEA